MKRIFLCATVLLCALIAHAQTYTWNAFPTTTNSSTRTFVNGNMTAVVSAVTGGGVTGYSYGSNSQIGGIGVCAGTPNGLFLEMSGASVSWNNSINVAITFAAPVCSPVTFTIYDINEDVWNDGTTNWSNYCDQVTITATDPSAAAIAPANFTFAGCAIAGNTSIVGNGKILRGRWTSNNCNCSTASFTINGGGQMIKTITILYNNTQPPTYGKYGVAQFQNIVISPITAVVAPSVSINATAIPCGSATTTLTASTGASSPSYQWSGTAGTSIVSPTSASTSVTGVGTYTCTVTSGGCSGTATYVLTQSSGITTSVSSQTNATCGLSNGSATVSASGGVGTYTYSWSPSGGTAATAIGLGAGSYTVTVTDGGSCSATQQVVITSTNSLSTSISSTDASCAGSANGTATVSVTGGTLPYTYSWSPGGGTDAAATHLAAGTYTCTITDGAGCTATEQAIVTQPPALTVGQSVVDASCSTCADGWGTVTPSGGTPPYNYDWNTVPQQTTATATGLVPGTYSVCVNDTKFCKTCVSVVVSTTVGINEVLDPNSTLFLYPNPSSGRFTLEVKNSVKKIQSIEVTDAMGRIVEKREKLSTSLVEFNLPDLSSGTYMMKIYYGDQVIQKEIVIAHQ